MQSRLENSLRNSHLELLENIALNEKVASRNSSVGLLVIRYTNSLRLVSDEPQTYLESCQTSKMKHFVKIVNDFQPLNFFAKCSILDV